MKQSQGFGIASLDLLQKSPIPHPNPLEDWKNSIRAGILRENTGFEYLQKCWSDDPAKADCGQEITGEVSIVGDCLRRCGADGLEQVPNLSRQKFLNFQTLF
ncbi:MAG: hypothetical protein V7K40_30540 [Nostoc sp.]|uniref:hypothetical protein n=1 Tax=Nostoc sp. TaxID=1180 RepID=UPI002FF8C0FA